MGFKDMNVTSLLTLKLAKAAVALVPRCGEADFTLLRAQSAQVNGMRLKFEVAIPSLGDKVLIEALSHTDSGEDMTLLAQKGIDACDI